MTIAGFVAAQLTAAGVPFESVRIGEASRKATWVVQPPSAEAQAVLSGLTAQSVKRAVALSELRRQRNKKLRETDWTQLSDAPGGVDVAAWRTYRQALRDLPAETQDPANPAWPSEPA